MKKSVFLAGLLSVFVLSGIVSATPRSWVSTYYTPPGSWTGWWYRSPVTDGYLDIRLLVEHAAFTDAVFSINYDSSFIYPLSTGNILNVRDGLSLVSAATENLEGTWKKTTFTFTGSIVIGEPQNQEDAVFRLRMIPKAEGTMPVTLWPTGSAYPDSYHTCSLSLLNNGVEVVHERKESNDGTQLFTFTDKTGATVFYHFDYNFGYPVAGYLEVEYADATVETFHASDHDRGITIDPANGAYFISPLANAVSYKLIFPGYYSSDVELNGRWSTSHTQPSGYIEVKEASEGFHHGIQASAEDIELTIVHPGIGTDFDTAVYTAAMAGNENGILSKAFAFDYIDEDTLKLTIPGGLAPDINYNLYVTKNGTLLGRAWFSASTFYPVTFTIKDEHDTPMPDILVSIPIWNMHGQSSISRQTDVNGQAVIELPGSEWGQWYQYRVVHAGYSPVSGDLNVYSAPVDIDITLAPAPGTTLADFAMISSWWESEECNWNNDCDGADMNLDGSVDMDDLLLVAAYWMKTTPVN